MGLLSVPGQPQRYGLLSPDVMGSINRAATMPPPAPAAAPRRGRVNGLRVAFDALLGNGDPFESLDKERARLEAEAVRPQMQARQAQLRAAAEAMGPAAMIAFETNPAKFGESLAEQYSPQVIAAGGIQSVIGSSQRVSAPQVTQFGDSLVRTDPLRPTPETLMQRGPTHAEQTARLTAERPVELAPGTVALNRDGSTFGRGADRILAAADGTDLVLEGGARLYGNAKDAPPVDPAEAAQRAQAAAAAEQGRSAMAANLQTGLTGARRFLDSAGTWTHLMPWQRQNRANLEGHLDTLKGNITFEKLTEMKANSPNGASGLGALSDNEARMLASTVAALSPDMSPQELGRSFEVIDRLVAKLEQPSPAAATGGAPVTVSTPQEAAALPPGTRYRNPQGQEYIR